MNEVKSAPERTWRRFVLWESVTATIGCGATLLFCLIGGVIWSITDALHYGMSWGVVGGLVGYPLLILLMCGLGGLVGAGVAALFKRGLEGFAVAAALVALLMVFVRPPQDKETAATGEAATAQTPAAYPHRHPNIGEVWYVQDHAYTAALYNDIVTGDGTTAYPAQTDSESPDRSFHFAYPFPCRVTTEGDSGFFECSVDGRGLINNQTVWTDHLMTRAEANRQSPGFEQATKFTAKPKPAQAANIISQTDVVDKAERARAKALLSRATDLYKEARAIIDEAPSTNAAALEMALPGNTAGVFYARERAYQDAVQGRPLGKARKDTAAFYAESNLLQLDAFLYGAVVSAISECNTHDAILNLKVVAADLAEARRDLAGHGSENFEPPDITNDLNGKSLCSN